MNTPIVDPSTLTEEQREAIKIKYKESINAEDATFVLSALFTTIGAYNIFNWLFGKEFFKKGE